MSWISVNQLPEDDGQVLIAVDMANGIKHVAMGWYNPNHGWSLVPTRWDSAITHWMPVPKPPMRPALPEAKDNPDGLHRKYIVSKANGEPVNPNAIYFVLRLDGLCEDVFHVDACIVAAMAYIERVRDMHAIHKHDPHGSDLEHLLPIANDLEKLIGMVNERDEIVDAKTFKRRDKQDSKRKD
jgi:hypothetical protein